ncbi:hypothetical protein ASC92_22795 [Variovorax sp. Root411]|nr:hypothetical protein ASC92_22795 [Variovorax sp. Root411]
MSGRAPALSLFLLASAAAGSSRPLKSRRSGVHLTQGQSLAAMGAWMLQGYVAASRSATSPQLSHEREALKLRMKTMFGLAAFWLRVEALA